jgi:hypothetical protein
MTLLTLPTRTLNYVLELWIKKNVKKAKSNVVSNHVIQKSNVTLVVHQCELSILQFALSMVVVLHIETMFDSLLYTKFIATFLVFLLAIL